MSKLFGKRALDFSWLELSLGAFVELDRGRVKQVTVQQMAREIVAICRSQRERVRLAEEYYDKYRDVLTHADRQDILRVMAETLMFITHGGRRMAVTEDPRRFLQSGAIGR